jgi:hypothetical protein
MCTAENMALGVAALVAYTENSIIIIIIVIIIMQSVLMRTFDIPVITLSLCNEMSPHFISEHCI